MKDELRRWISVEDAREVLGILDDMVDHYERNDDPADWPGWVKNAYDLLRRIGK